MPITAFYDYAIQVPPIDEQREIARQCDEVEKQINEMISGINKEITLVEELRTKLISDVVTGQVDVRNVKIPAYETETDIIDSEEDSDEENQEELHRHTGRNRCGFPPFIISLISVPYLAAE